MFQKHKIRYMSSPKTIPLNPNTSGARDLTQNEADTIDKINEFVFSIIQINFCTLIAGKGISLSLEKEYIREEEILISLADIEELGKKLTTQPDYDDLEKETIEKCKKLDQSSKDTWANDNCRDSNNRKSTTNDETTSNKISNPFLDELRKIKEKLLGEHPHAKKRTRYSIKKKIHYLGYYKSEDKTIHLCMNTIGNDEEVLLHTYIHEMFHAYYDCGAPYSILRKIEEAIVEYSALCFIKKWKGICLTNAFRRVSKNKKSVALSFYGFGAYLFSRNNLNYIRIYKDIKKHIQDTKKFDEMFVVGYPMEEELAKQALANIFYKTYLQEQKQPLLLVFQLYLHKTLLDLELTIIDKWWCMRETKREKLTLTAGSLRISENTLRAKRRKFLPCFEEFHKEHHDWTRYAGASIPITELLKKECCTFSEPFAEYVIQYMNSPIPKSQEDLKHDLKNLYKPKRKKHSTFEERINEYNTFIKEHGQFPRERSEDTKEASLANWYRKNKSQIVRQNGKISNQKLDTEFK